jgi:hypothetical protein
VETGRLRLERPSSPSLNDIITSFNASTGTLGTSTASTYSTRATQQPFF